MAHTILHSLGGTRLFRRETSARTSSFRATFRRQPERTGYALPPKPPKLGTALTARAPPAQAQPPRRPRSCRDACSSVCGRVYPVRAVRRGRGGVPPAGSRAVLTRSVRTCYTAHPSVRRRPVWSPHDLGTRPGDDRMDRTHAAGHACPGRARDARPPRRRPGPWELCCSCDYVRRSRWLRCATAPARRRAA
jgi:hypothetical protein